MDSIFLIKLAISFLIGGLWIVTATYLAEKFGPKVGGLVSGLPSTVMFGTFFIAWTQNPESAVKATTIIPIVGGINCLFLLCYVLLVKKNLWLSLFISFSLWSILSATLVLLKFNSYPLSLLTYFILLVISYCVMEYKLKIRSIKGKKISYTPALIFIRGFLSGFIVALSVVLSKIGGPMLGGMFSMFPAMFTSTMLITYLSQGVEFSIATMKSAMLGGVSIVVYSLIVRYTYVPLGIGWGTIAAVITSFSLGYLMYKNVLTKLN